MNPESGSLDVREARDPMNCFECPSLCEADPLQVPDPNAEAGHLWWHFTKNKCCNDP